MLHRLLLIAGWGFPLLVLLLFVIKGQHYDVAYFEPPVSELSALPIPSAVEQWVLEGGSALPAERMFEKINGKSDYYEQFGAVELCYGEWVANGQRWDMYLYRFETPQGARGAYNGERPANGQALDGFEGYKVPGQVALAAGTSYLQLGAQVPGADPAPALELARALIPYFDGAEEEAPSEAVVDLMALAGADAVSDAEEFMPESAFGFSALHNVRMVTVSLNGVEAVWYTTLGDDALVAAFIEELGMYGGEELFNDAGASGGSMFGSWGLAGVLNGEVWGVQNAPSREVLMTHWAALKERLGANP